MAKEQGAVRKRIKRKHWIWISIVLVVLLALPAVHYRFGKNLLVYFGYDLAPAGLELEGESRRELSEPRDDFTGVGNFAQVSGELYRGAQPTPEGYRKLKEVGVRTIVSLRDFHSDRDDLQGTGLRYLRIPMNPAEPTDEEVAAFLGLFKDEENVPVFVHCQRGEDRTGVAVAAYRMSVQGWAKSDAVKELPIFGFNDVWVGSLEYLDAFDPAKMIARVAASPPADTDQID